MAKNNTADYYSIKKEDIKKALALAVGANKLNIKYIDSCLAAIKRDTSEDEVVLNEAQTKLLNDFYRKIR